MSPIPLHCTEWKHGEYKGSFVQYQVEMWMFFGRVALVPRERSKLRDHSVDACLKNPVAAESQPFAFNQYAK